MLEVDLEMAKKKIQTKYVGQTPTWLPVATEIKVGYSLSDYLL